MLNSSTLPIALRGTTSSLLSGFLLVSDRQGVEVPLACRLLRRAIHEGFLSCLSLAVLCGVSERTVQRWVAGRTTPAAGRDGLLWEALRLLSPPERAAVFTWMIEETGGGCAVVDEDTYRLVLALRGRPV